MPAPAAADALLEGWGSPALRRTTLTLSLTQLVSWGVLFYGFAVVSPQVTADTGWSESVVAGAFSAGLVVAGLAAPGVARALARIDPRLVLTAGSVLGAAGMVLFATAQHLGVLYAAWALIGLAMSATLYEPAMAVLVALDPRRRHRTLTVVTVAGGLASTVFAPLGGLLVDRLGWRAALLVLGIGGCGLTAVLHAFVLPARVVADAPRPKRSTISTRPVRRLQAALLFEQAAITATTAHLIGLLVARGASVTGAGVVLGIMGIGKVAGRLLLLGPVGALPFTALAAACNALQLVGLVVPLVTTTTVALLLPATVVGAASGATTVLRPMIVVDLVGTASFAAVSARLQRATALARAGAPFAIGAGAATIGWTGAWLVALAAFTVATWLYLRVGAEPRQTPLQLTGRSR